MTRIVVDAAPLQEYVARRRADGAKGLTLMHVVGAAAGRAAAEQPQARREREARLPERLAEFAGRLCYMSQKNPAKRNTRDYLENIKKQGHGSVLEHANYSVLLEGVSRSLTHELVRQLNDAREEQAKRLLVLASCATALVGFSAGPATAGEVRRSHEF